MDPNEATNAERRARCVFLLPRPDFGDLLASGLFGRLVPVVARLHQGGPRVPSTLHHDLWFWLDDAPLKVTDYWLVLGWLGEVVPEGSDRLGRRRGSPDRTATDRLIRIALDGDPDPLRLACEDIGVIAVVERPAPLPSEP